MPLMVCGPAALRFALLLALGHIGKGQDHEAHQPEHPENYGGTE
jgi:hypothetical protein